MTIIVGKRDFAEEFMREAGRQGKLNRENYDWFFPGNGFYDRIIYVPKFPTSVQISHKVALIDVAFP